MTIKLKGYIKMVELTLCCILTREWGMPLVYHNILGYLGNAEILIMTDFELSKAPIKTFPLIENNIGKRRNFLLNEAQGEIVMFFDDDDIQNPDRFSKQLKFLKDHPGVNVCCAHRHPLVFLETNQVVCFEAYSEGTLAIRNGQNIWFDDIHKREGYGLTQRSDFKFIDGHLNIMTHKGDNVTPRNPRGTVDNTLIKKALGFSL